MTDVSEESEDVTTVNLTLSESEFNEYKTLGYFNNIAYRWSVIDYVYTVYISREYYELFKSNMENPGLYTLLYYFYITLRS